MSNRRDEEDAHLSELTNSFMFAVLLICMIIVLAWRRYDTHQLQQECVDRGGYVERVPDTFDSWTCRMEDRD